MFYFIASRLNANNNPAGLEEYVDILQVQQLLLDSTSSPTNPSTSSSSAANVSCTARHRPRVNIQKATEYSTTTMANATNGLTTTPSTQGMELYKSMKMKKRKNNCIETETLSIDKEERK